jgi:membrane protein DedA with SNARE-associated domain
MPDRSSLPADIARYSGMAFQLFILLWLAYKAGDWADSKLASEKPFATIGLLLLAIFSYLYYIIKQTSKPR